MEYQNISTEINNQTLWVYIDRESKMNALNRATLQEIKHAVEHGIANSAVRTMVITGKGNKAFAAGADIAEFSAYHIEEAEAMSAAGHEVMNCIENSPKPVIAAVNGFALGGGCELAMACHLRVASDNARFGQPEINLAIVPGYGGTQRLCRLIGHSKAVEMLLTGNAIKADEALQLGLVSQVIPTNEFLDAVQTLAETLSSKSPLTIAAILRCVKAGYNSIHEGLHLEIKEFGASFGTQDFKEGTSAFLEKRKASFSGN